MNEIESILRAFVLNNLGPNTRMMTVHNVCTKTVTILATATDGTNFIAHMSEP